MAARAATPTLFSSAADAIEAAFARCAGEPLLVAGAAAYLGEGTRRAVAFTNSNPAYVRLMLRWFERYVPLAGCALTVQHPSDAEAAAVRRFWRTELAGTEFTRVSIAAAASVRCPQGVARIECRLALPGQQAAATRIVTCSSALLERLAAA